MFNIRNITFTLHRTDGTKQEIVKPVIGDDDDVSWVANQIADVNSCCVVAVDEAGKTITTVGSVQ